LQSWLQQTLPLLISGHNNYSKNRKREVTVKSKNRYFPEKPFRTFWASIKNWKILDSQTIREEQKAVAKLASANPSSPNFQT
jgi:hypothetical protein